VRFEAIHPQPPAAAVNEYATFRGITPDDAPLLADMEARGHLGLDPDFDVVCVGRHARDEKTVREVLREAYVRGWIVEEGEGENAPQPWGDSTTPAHRGLHVHRARGRVRRGKPGRP
jgi:hypothetical protein